MAEVSYPFDAGAGSVITEQQWSNLAAVWQDNGVVAEGPWQTALKVTTLAEPGIIYVEIGEANILGFHFENTAQKPLAVPANNNGANSRIDLVALQLDKNTNAIALTYKTGTPASSPVAPALVTTGGLHEIPLAQITMGPNAVSVPNTQPQLIDKRPFIGKRLGVSEDGSGLSQGSIYYNPVDGKFYAKNGSASTAIFVGTPPAPPAATGLVICTSTTRPSSPTTGAQIYETDTGRIMAYVSGAWGMISVAPYAVKRSANASVQHFGANSAGSLPVTFSTTDFNISPPGMAALVVNSQGFTLPSLPVASYWAIAGTVYFDPAQPGTSYTAFMGDNIYDGLIGDDTSGTATQRAAMAPSGTVFVAANTTKSITLDVGRTTAVSTVMNVQNRTITAHRIG